MFLLNKWTCLCVQLAFILTLIEIVAYQFDLSLLATIIGMSQPLYDDFMQNLHLEPMIYKIEKILQLFLLFIYCCFYVSQDVNTNPLYDGYRRDASVEIPLYWHSAEVSSILHIYNFKTVFWIRLTPILTRLVTISKALDTQTTNTLEAVATRYTTNLRASKKKGGIDTCPPGVNSMASHYPPYCNIHQFDSRTLILTLINMLLLDIMFHLMEILNIFAHTIIYFRSILIIFVLINESSMNQFMYRYCASNETQDRLDKFVNGKLICNYYSIINCRSLWDEYYVFIRIKLLLHNIKERIAMIILINCFKLTLNYTSPAWPCGALLWYYSKCMLCFFIDANNKKYIAFHIKQIYRHIKSGRPRGTGETYYDRLLGQFGTYIGSWHA